MITFSKLGKNGMNLGNQLHQIASLIGFSEKYNCELVLPEWKYSQYFEHPPAQANVQTNFFVKEEDYHYVPEFWDKYTDIFRTQNTDILGFLQSEKYWPHCKEKVHHALTFKREFLLQTKTKFFEAFQRKTIAISIRRGDFVANPNHFLLPIDFYLQALLKFFPNYKNYNIIIFSDDSRYCKMEIKSLCNFYFAADLNAIEQLCLMSMCDHFIISNSTFSWWGAMLGEKKDSVIIRSPYYVSGELKAKLNTKDYYPDRWVSYDHVEEKIDLRTVRRNRLLRMIDKNKTRYKLKRKSIMIKLKPFINLSSITNNKFLL